MICNKNSEDATKCSKYQRDICGQGKSANSCCSKHAFQDCKITNGLMANTGGDCKCGVDTTCSQQTGMYCTAAGVNATCSRHAQRQCLYQNGRNENTFTDLGDCKCGRENGETCTKDTGMYCFSTGICSKWASGKFLYLFTKTSTQYNNLGSNSDFFFVFLFSNFHQYFNTSNNS